MEAQYKEVMEVESVDRFMALFGVRDENVGLLKQELGVEVFARGTELTISGEEDKVHLARLVADGDHLARMHVEGHDRRFVDNDLAVIDYQRVGRSEVDGQLLCQ